VKRQQALMNGCYRGQSLADLMPEERLLADLIRHDTEPNSGLQTYIRNMMAVMAFDADRRGAHFAVRAERVHPLAAVAVTEALHYFIVTMTPRR